MSFFLWIFGYQLTSLGAKQIYARNPHLEWLPPLIAALNLLVLVSCYSSASHHRRAGRTVIFGTGELHFLLLGLLPACNWFFRSQQTVEWSLLVVLLCGAVAEEILFRGCLLQLLEKIWGRGAVFVTAVLFALYHYGQSGGMMQICCAFSAGMAYGAVTRRCGSLLPAILAHCATNITGAVGGPSAVGLLVCIVVYLCYGICLIRND